MTTQPQFDFRPTGIVMMVGPGRSRFSPELPKRGEIAQVEGPGCYRVLGYRGLDTVGRWWGIDFRLAPNPARYRQHLFGWDWLPWDGRGVLFGSPKSYRLTHLVRRWSRAQRLRKQSLARKTLTKGSEYLPRIESIEAQIVEVLGSKAEVER
ncbi:MAG: hypothetical protein ABQ298_03675 [Puniceicoccaceae bacterium]